MEGWYKKKRIESHADDWLMTYADMITLLLCFFVIFLSVSVPKKDVAKELHLPQHVEEKPVNPPPDVIEGNLPLHGTPKAEQPTIKDIVEPPRPIPVSVVAPPPTLPATYLVEATTKQAGVSEVPPPTSYKSLVAELPQDKYKSLDEVVKELKTSGSAKIEQKGDRITSIEISSGSFFPSGSAEVSNAGKFILRDVAANLKSTKFKDYQITVEGHTDNAPISTPQFPSNWELSTARAAAVLHALLQQGVPAQKLRAAGYADTFPVAPNREANGDPIPENQARNRRVVIKLEKIEKTE